MRPYLFFAVTMLTLAGLLLLLSAYADKPAFPQPPGALQNEATILVQFVAPERLAAVCKSHGATVVAAACTVDRKLMILPNPCQRFNDTSYAQLACHELGHVNGWPPNHGS